MFKTERQKQVLQVLLIITGLAGFILLLYARSEVFVSDSAFHIKIGEWIIDNNSIPKFDTFSLLSSNIRLNFMAHEWLFGVLLYGVDYLFSLNGIIILTILAVFASYLLVIFKSKSSLPAIIVSTLFIFFQFSRGVLCRPDTFSAVLVVFLGYVFAHAPKNTYKRFIITSLGVMFLANFHGGYSTLVLVQFLWILLCYTVINKKVDKVLVTNFIVCVISSFINPYGLNIHKYILVISDDIKMLNNDYLPFSFNGVAQIGVILVIFILSIIGYIKEKEKSIVDLLIMFMYLVMLLTYARTLNIFTYGFVLYMSKYLKWCFDKRVYLYIINIISICLIFLVFTHEKLPNKSTEDYISTDLIGENIVNKLSNERYFNTITSGGYLIYLDKKPFIDGRNDVYTSEFGNPDLFLNSVKAMHSESLMYNLTTKYGLTYILLEKNNITSQIFYASSLWEVEEESNCYVLFKRK